MMGFAMMDFTKNVKGEGAAFEGKQRIENGFQQAVDKEWLSATAFACNIVYVGQLHVSTLHLAHVQS